MAGRPRNPDTNYKVSLRRTGKYRYAATQPTFTDPNTGKVKRRFVYWGDVTEDLRFIPNDRYRLASKKERSRLIFPDGWDLTEADKINNAAKELPVSDDPYIVNDGSAFSGTVITDPAEEQFNNRFYGGPWFLWEIAVKKHVLEDLLDVFDDDQMLVNDIMTLAMFPMLTRWNYSQTERWQSYTKTPSSHALTSSFITRLTQSIHDSSRMNFLKLRIKRQASGAIVACDSTTRSAYGHCLADIRWGRNKDNAALQNTLEVVVYSLDAHEPIYYRTFAGNESDSRTLRTVISDLEALGCPLMTIIFDRGYETDENIEEMIRCEQSFLVCGKTGRSPVADEIMKIRYDEHGLPEDMNYSRENDLYACQRDLAKTVQLNDGSNKEVTLKINLFLNMTRRIRELVDISEELKDEKDIIEKHDSRPCSTAELKSLKKRCPHYSLKLDKNGCLSSAVKEKKVAKEKAAAGFFSSVSYRVEGNAIDQYELYVLRDEQEKYFESMKDQLGFNMQRNWSEDGKTGRLFILFISLILRTEIRSVWKKKLRSDYASSVDVLHTMLPIRFVEYEDGSTHVTGFTTSQVNICRAFDLPMPSDCLSAGQKAAIDRAAAGRKRGRPKGSLNKEKVLAQL